MKVKNFKSVIHNFSDSLQSIDYRISSLLVFDEIVLLHSKHGLSAIEFDFVNKTIAPKIAENKNTKQILDDYLSTYIEYLPQFWE